jgi:hypothetical protein
MLHYLMLHPMNQPKDIPRMRRSPAHLARLEIVGVGETKRRKKNKKRKIKNK